MSANVYLLIYSLVFLSCRSDHNSVGKNYIKEDTVIKDIPIGRKDETSVRLKKRIETLSGIEDLENGYRDRQIRLWFANSTNIEKLVILRNTGSIWEGEMNTLKFIYNSGPLSENTLASIERIKKRIYPKSNWNKLIDSLEHLGISTLPDMENIPGYVLGTDGRWITIEIATLNSYRIYSYYEPSFFASKFIQAGKIEAIANLIEEEFNFRRPK